MKLVLDEEGTQDARTLWDEVRVVTSVVLIYAEAHAAIAAAERVGRLAAHDLRPVRRELDGQFSGQLQTLDHIFVTRGLHRRVRDMRYVHFDNDYFDRGPRRAAGVSDHDAPLVTLGIGRRDAKADVRGRVRGKVRRARGSG